MVKYLKVNAVTIQSCQLLIRNFISIEFYVTGLSVEMNCSPALLKKKKRLWKNVIHSDMLMP